MAQAELIGSQICLSIFHEINSFDLWDLVDYLILSTIFDDYLDNFFDDYFDHFRNGFLDLDTLKAVLIQRALELK